MIEKFSIHNKFWQSADEFINHDPHLELLHNLDFVSSGSWWGALTIENQGIFILTGGRQIGKSTSLKLHIKHLLKDKINPNNIFYLPCDQIINRSQLHDIINNFLEKIDDQKFYLFIDEITFVSDWEKTIKGLADEGHFRKGMCIITGSDKILLQKGQMALPGRRGDSDKHDYEIAPLTFRQYIALVNNGLLNNVDNNLELLSEMFENYLICGGYLKSINEFHKTKKIKVSTYQIYKEWVYGDFLKNGKKSESLDEVFLSIFETLGSQVSFLDLAKRCSSISKDTFIDYLHLLERMDVIYICYAFDQNKLTSSPKKAKKIYFKDPFILESIRRHLAYKNLKIDQSIIVEGVIVNHFSKIFPTYYIKADGEVDIVYINKNRFYPIEIKWTNQIRKKDLKQILKYNNSEIITKYNYEGEINGIKTLPIIKKLLL